MYQQAGGAAGDAGFDPTQGAPGGGEGGADYYDADYTTVDDDK